MLTHHESRLSLQPTPRRNSLRHGIAGGVVDCLVAHHAQHVVPRGFACLKSGTPSAILLGRASADFVL